MASRKKILSSFASIFSTIGRHPHWRAFVPVMAALLFTGRSFAQARETNLPPAPTQQANLSPTPTQKPGSSAQTPETNPSPAPTQQANLPTPTQQENSSPSALKKLSLEQLMDLDVTSVAKEPEPYGQAPAAIDVITGDEIRRSGASSIPEALRLADNLEVAQATSSSWDISARGFNSSVSDKLLVLIDGRSVYTPLFAGIIWNNQDYLLEDLDRIEVISGPGGTLWGANAVNGVINITTKSAKETQGLYLEGGGGSQLQDFFGARYGGTLASDIYYRVYGKFFNEGPETYTDGSSSMDTWDHGQGGFRIDADGSSENKFTVQGDIYAGNTTTIPGGEGTPAASGNSSGGNILGRWTRTFASDDDLSLQIYYSRDNLVVPFQSSGIIPAGPLGDGLDTIDVNFQDRFPLGLSNHIVWGGEYRFTHDVVQDAPVVAFVPNTLDLDLYSGFVQDEDKLTENLMFTIGSKIEHNGYTGYEFEPSGRLQWNVTDKQTLWCAVSRAVRMPSRYDEDLDEPSPAYGQFLDNNNTFVSEILVAYELGYRAQLSPKVSTSISTFFNNYTDLRSLSYTPVTFVPLYFGNNDLGQTYGIEFTSDYQMLEWWRLHAGYDYLWESIWTAPGQLDLSHDLAETADPPNQVFLRSSMDLPGKTELDAAFRWIDTVHNGSLGATVPGIIPAYAELDLRLGWHITPELEVSAVGQNLLQNEHVEAGVPGTTQEEIARSVYGKVALRF
jgi:iron complex outermembrane recepter protein